MENLLSVRNDDDSNANISPAITTGRHLMMYRNPSSRDLSQLQFHVVHTKIMMCNLHFPAVSPAPPENTSVFVCLVARAPLKATTFGFASGDSCFTGIIAAERAGTVCQSSPRSACSRASSMQCFLGSVGTTVLPELVKPVAPGILSSLPRVLC